MTVKEIDGLLQVKDEKGDVNTIYPMTKAENVEGLYGEDGKIPADQLPEMDYLPISGGDLTGHLSLPEDYPIILGGGGGMLFGDSSGDITLESANKLVLIAGLLEIDVNLSQLKNVGEPTDKTDAATKGYVDDTIRSAIGNAIGGSY